MKPQKVFQFLIGTIETELRKASGQPIEVSIPHRYDRNEGFSYFAG